MRPPRFASKSWGIKPHHCLHIWFLKSDLRNIALFVLNNGIDEAGFSTSRGNRKHELIASLLRAKLEVAIPIRDRGIDVLAYVDQEPRSTYLKSIAIQMKSAVGGCFSIESKYEKFSNLILAYVWHATEPTQTTVFAVKYSEALAIASEVGYTRTPSWAAGCYVTTRPSARLRGLLEPFRATEARWLSLF
jgi:hypothetical protein